MTDWRSPAELLEHGFGRSRLVLINEAHSGLARCVRTREVGRALLPVAHALGVRHLAMEALWDRGVTERTNATRVLEGALDGYLGQPEMRALVATALELGWTLHGYEADNEVARRRTGPETRADVNWRENQQARNLAAVITALGPGERLLTWCGNGHLTRHAMTAVVDGETETWTPMGSLVEAHCGVAPFALDQTTTVAWDGRERDFLEPFAGLLDNLGGSAGFLAGDAPEELAWLGDHADAFVLSLDNALVE
jgi:hypothetical protein